MGVWKAPYVPRSSSSSELYETFHGSHRIHLFQELVANDQGQKNWKGISISIFVILAILASVAVSVIILTPDGDSGLVKGDPFTVANILDPRFAPRRFNGTWISGECVCA